MEELLFLAHRIPYPPDKGDKIRSFHLLRMLAERYRVSLGAFVDDEQDWQHADRVGALCQEAHLLPLRRSPFALIKASFRNEPLSLAHFSDPGMAAWVTQKAGPAKIRRIFVFSSAMAQYVLDLPQDRERRVVLDFVDVDSDKWRQYSRIKRWPLSLLFAREASTLLRFERRAAAAFDATVFVSRAEARSFCDLAPEVANRVTWLENGVDADYFVPEQAYPDPYAGDSAVVVFTGAMDYFANVDAVTWFVRNVLPAVRERIPAARFAIVGARPTSDVQRLGDEPGVTVTGRVDDVRPYLAHARLAVAPMRIARGIQNKVLEAMAMARPVVVSAQALEGLEWPGAYPLLADGVEEWVNQVSAALVGNTGDIGTRLRRWVLASHAWEGQGNRCAGWLEGAAPVRR
jgi:sugar transferase (PEP-CTERM/EpsH1 system associated)